MRKIEDDNSFRRRGAPKSKTATIHDEIPFLLKTWMITPTALCEHYEWPLSKFELSGIFNGKPTYPQIARIIESTVAQYAWTYRLPGWEKIVHLSGSKNLSWPPPEHINPEYPVIEPRFSENVDKNLWNGSLNPKPRD